MKHCIESHLIVKKWMLQILDFSTTAIIAIICSNYANPAEECVIALFVKWMLLTLIVAPFLFFIAAETKLLCLWFNWGLATVAFKAISMISSFTTSDVGYEYVF